ncbi:hypothetical protein [Pseudonocardia asaccharolytica]|uniref:Uncharacterized protein n=1 Tax=Pseudonocardia asaccharolytica DSM 44247 = NBRC 16224 TaxID=1123024 RepID=A0A511D4H3_9PSEU|nr:hypothetical protein [Pseudonocardia asaccharolytica]GEL19699.1 hypothetical protein PA7_35360 [Pseudonocardia asaccharolytica DSM 44247 = NBRC 16224]
MTIVRDTSRFPLLPVLLAGVGAQFADDALFLVLPPAAVLAPLAVVLTIALTAGAARLVTRGLRGPAVARAGLAVGAVSAGLGLVLSGLGWLPILFATLTLIAGVAGAIVRRPTPTV